MPLTIYHGNASTNQLDEFSAVAPSFDHGNMFTTEFQTHDYPYMVDNGAYSAYRNGQDWDPRPFLDMLETCEQLPRDPDGVVLPDIVGDAEATYRRARRWAGWVPFPTYFPGQDGMEISEAVQVAQELGCVGVFVGGTFSWKRRTAEAWVEAAHEQGLECHVARPGGIRWADRIGADSVDTTTFAKNDTPEKLADAENVPEPDSAAEAEW